MFHSELGIADSEEDNRPETPRNPLEMKPIELADYMWKRSLAHHMSIVVDIFQGHVCSNFICKNCKKVSRFFEVFILCPLEVPLMDGETQETFNSNKTSKNLLETNLDSIFMHYLRSEYVNIKNTIPCQHCGVKTNALRNTEIWLLPPVLVIRLKKYTEEGFRRNIKIDFPLINFDLSDFCALQTDSPLTYDLQSVIYHSGKTLKSGKSYAISRNQRTGQFWLYDGENAVLVSDIETIVNEDAYILFYVRNNLPKITRHTKAIPYGMTMNASAGVIAASQDEKMKSTQKTLSMLNTTKISGLPPAMKSLMMGRTADERQKKHLHKGLHELEGHEVEEYLYTHNEMKSQDIPQNQNDEEEPVQSNKYLDRYKMLFKKRMEDEIEGTQSQSIFAISQKSIMTNQYKSSALRPKQNEFQLGSNKKEVLMDLKKKEQRLTKEDEVSDEIVMDVVLNRLRNKTEAKYVPLKSDVRGNKYYGEEAVKRIEKYNEMIHEDDDGSHQQYHAYESKKKNEEMDLKTYKDV